MKANSANSLFVGAQIAVFLCALMLLSTKDGSAQSSTNFTKHSTSSKSSSNEIGTEDDLTVKTADSTRTMQVVVEGQYIATDCKQQLASALPHALSPVMTETDKVSILRPSFIPAYAFSNQDMIAPYHNLVIDWWHKLPSADVPHWMKLSPSVAQYWTGTKMEPFWVMTEPDKEHPGNFTFVSLYPGGPKGWLQSTGERSAWGHPEYRYWFDLN